MGESKHIVERRRCHPLMSDGAGAHFYDSTLVPLRGKVDSMSNSLRNGELLDLGRGHTRFSHLGPRKYVALCETHIGGQRDSCDLWFLTESPDANLVGGLKIALGCPQYSEGSFTRFCPLFARPVEPTLKFWRERVRNRARM